MRVFSKYTSAETEVWNLHNAKSKERSYWVTLFTVVINY